jgi:DNA-binding transcriptional regulator LsrR (DeoR family)
MDGLTQGDIAGRLGITRLRVNRLLGEARSGGLVNIRVNARLAECVKLERELVADSGLRDAVVVPTPDDVDQIPVAIGRATAEYLDRQLRAPGLRGFGVGWGTTLRETIRHLPRADLPALSVASMMGGLTHGLELNTFEIASEFARRVNAQCHYLAAPIYAGSARSRDTILAQDVFREAFRRIAACELALVSVGDLSERSLLIRYGLPGDVAVDALRNAGAVGDVMGTFLDGHGAAVRHPLNGRVIAPPVEMLRRIGTAIVASGGLNKTAILAGVLRARLCSTLVTDEAAARAVLGLLRGG